jgi:hypothetical protein
MPPPFPGFILRYRYYRQDFLDYRGIRYEQNAIEVQHNLGASNSHISTIQTWFLLRWEQYWRLSSYVKVLCFVTGCLWLVYHTVEPITVAARSKAWTVLFRSNAWIVDVRVCICSMLSCMQVVALRRADHSSKASYRLCKNNHETEEEARAQQRTVGPLMNEWMNITQWRNIWNILIQFIFI